VALSGREGLRPSVGVSEGRTGAVVGEGHGGRQGAAEGADGRGVDPRGPTHDDQENAFFRKPASGIIRESQVKTPESVPLDPSSGIR
jgi:hypothetical protein